MTTILTSLVPVFLLIALGFGLRARQFVPDLFWPAIEKLTYFVFFPALLFQNCRRAPLDGAGSLALAMGLGVLGTAALALAARPLVKSGPSFTSLFQGTIRPNTYVGLAAAAALYGKTGTALTSICVAMVVPLVNLLSVLLEKVRAFVGILQGFDGAKFGVLGRQADSFVTFLLENAQGFFTAISRQNCGEESTIADDDAKRCRVH